MRRADVVFYTGERQLEGGDSPEVDLVEVRFRGSKVTKGKKGLCW